jgi:hypothetical protein
MSAFQKILQPVLILLAGLLAGCGGGSGDGTTAGIGGTGQIASGTITGFGSIFVNGIEFLDIDTATCVIADSDSTGACQANLQLGMVVEVTGTVNGTIGNATQVVFDNDVEGAVTGISTPAAGDVIRTFTVLNTAVQVDSASTKFSGGIDFENLSNDTVVEVSGFFDDAGVLQATYVEGKGSLTLGVTEVEIKGTVSAASANGASRVGDTFTIEDSNGTNNITVTIVIGTDLSDMPGGVVSNGTLVEVRGTITSATTISASRVEPEDSSIGDDGDEVSIEGLITDFVSQSNFRVDGQLVDAGTATLSPGTLVLENGVKVEVEGTISGSTLISDEVEARGNDIKIEARVSAKDENANTVTVQFAGGDPLAIRLNTQTQMEDKTGAAQGFKLSDIQAGDFLEIRGFLDADPMVRVVASELRRNDVNDDILQGPVDSVVTGSSVTILGVTFSSDGNTEFEINDSGSDRATFYATVKPGCVVKIQDGDLPSTSPDGFADEMDLEN